MPRRISERGHRIGQRVRADDVRARAATGQRGRARGLPGARCRAARTARSRASRRCTSRACSSSARSCTRARSSARPTRCSTRTWCSRARSTATLDPYLDALRGAGARVPTSGGGAASATRAATDRAAFRAFVRARSRRGPGCSSPRCRTRPCAEVREALALRERVIDFAVDAQGLDAAALQERFRGDVLMLGRPPNVPRRERPARATSTSPTSRATSCAATRCPPRRTCCCGSSTSTQARALMRRMLPQVATAAPWIDGRPRRR